MRNTRMLVSSIAVMIGSAGCSAAHEMELPDAGVIGYDAWHVDDASHTNDGSPPEQCGSSTCPLGTYCCNPSCGICIRPGGACPALACDDAGPPVITCGGFVNAQCPTGYYCEFMPGSCGIADLPGACRPAPVGCPDPGGVPVCGCDGRDYSSDCLAHQAGTDIAHAGSCAIPPPPAAQGISAARSCGPADGPAWTFTIASGAPACGTLPGGTALTISVWQALESAAQGSVFTIGGASASQGNATYCPAGGGGPPCFTLDGTLTLDWFYPDRSASFSYDLREFRGTHYTGTHSIVGFWCPSHPLCG